MLPLHVCFSTHLRTPNTSLFPYTTLFRSHAGRPPAHHGVVLHGGGGNELSALLHRRLGVHRALDRLQDVDLAHTAIAVDTGPDVLGPALGNLAGQVRVGQHLAAHGKKVEVAHADVAVRSLRLDAA